MTITIMGATGHLGGLVIGSLLKQGYPASEIVAVGRNERRLAELTDIGVSTRRADYGDSGTLDAALAGSDSLLLISASEIGQRFVQHQGVIDAAQRAGISHLAYTSIANADTSSTILAREHLQTEQYLQTSNLDYVVLRNGWYHENYTQQIPTYLERGIVGSGGHGQVSGAARADYAEAAAAVMTTAWSTKKVFELGGFAYTLEVLAAEIARQTGREVRYTDLPVEIYQGILESALPTPVAEMLADADRGLAAGDLLVSSNDLADLIGHPPATLAEAVAKALADDQPKS